MRASEFHAAVQRLAFTGLIEQESRKPRGKPVEEFLFYGVPYAFRGGGRAGDVCGTIPTPQLAFEIRDIAYE